MSEKLDRRVTLPRIKIPSWGSRRSSAEPIVEEHNEGGEPINAESGKTQLKVSMTEEQNHLILWQIFDLCYLHLRKT